MKKRLIFTVILILAATLFLPAAAESPRDRATWAYPVSAKRAVHVDNENVKTIIMNIEGMEKPYICYVVPEETAHLRFEIAAADHPGKIVYEDFRGSSFPVSDLLDPERNVYSYDQPTEEEDDGANSHFTTGMLADRQPDSGDPDGIGFALLRDEAFLDEVVAMLRGSGCSGDIRWEYADSGQADSPAEDPDQSYTVRVVDQYNEPVPGMYVNFCTDTACMMARGDENGVIVFSGAPDIYHVQILKAPEGYSFDAGFELYTDRDYGDWVLNIWKD